MIYNFAFGARPAFGWPRPKVTITARANMLQTELGTFPTKKVGNYNIHTTKVFCSQLFSPTRDILFMGLY